MFLALEARRKSLTLARWKNPPITACPPEHWSGKRHHAGHWGINAVIGHMEVDDALAGAEHGPAGPAAVGRGQVHFHLHLHGIALQPLAHAAQPIVHVDAELVRKLDTLKQQCEVSDGSTLATDGRDVVPVKEGTGLNQALLSQCSLVTLRDNADHYFK